MDESAPGAVSVSGPPRLRGYLHLVGAVVVAFSGIVLWRAAPDALLRAGVVAYVGGVTAMLATSAAYHVPTWSPAAKRVMRRADHSAIFLGIAGTYTPLVLAVMPGRAGTLLLIGVWVGAVAGMAVRNVFHHVRTWKTTVPYIVMGWVGVLTLPAFWAHSRGVALLVIAGGLAYTAGAVVYARRRPNPWPATFGFHEVFHALTLVAIALHWTAVLLVVAG